MGIPGFTSRVTSWWRQTPDISLVRAEPSTHSLCIDTGCGPWGSDGAACWVGGLDLAGARWTDSTGEDVLKENGTGGVCPVCTDSLWELQPGSQRVMQSRCSLSLPTSLRCLPHPLCPLPVLQPSQAHLLSLDTSLPPTGPRGQRTLMLACTPPFSPRVAHMPSFPPIPPPTCSAGPLGSAGVPVGAAPVVSTQSCPCRPGQESKAQTTEHFLGR